MISCCKISCYTYAKFLVALIFGIMIFIFDRKHLSNRPATYTIKEFRRYTFFFTFFCFAVFFIILSPDDFLCPKSNKTTPEHWKNSFALAGYFLGVALPVFKMKHEEAFSRNNLSIFDFTILSIVFFFNAISTLFYDIFYNPDINQQISYFLAVSLFPAMLLYSFRKMLSPSSRQPNKYQVTAKPLSDQGIEPTDDEEEDSK